MTEARELGETIRLLRAMVRARRGTGQRSGLLSVVTIEQIAEWLEELLELVAREDVAT